MNKYQQPHPGRQPNRAPDNKGLSWWGLLAAVCVIVVLGWIIVDNYYVSESPVQQEASNPMPEENRNTDNNARRAGSGVPPQNL